MNKLRCLPFLLLVLSLIGCTTTVKDSEPVSQQTEQLPGFFEPWTATDSFQFGTFRGVTVFPTSVQYLTRIHTVAIDSNGYLYWAAFDEEGDDLDTATGHGWNIVPGQSSTTAIKSTSVPAVMRCGTLIYVYTIRANGTPQYVIYDLTDYYNNPPDPALQYGTWGTWTAMPIGYKLTYDHVAATDNCTSMLTLKMSGGSPVYALAYSATSWAGPYTMDTLPTGSTGMLSTAEWNGGRQAFVEANGKFYVSTYDGSCSTPGSHCWNGWTQLPALSTYGVSKPMLTANNILNPMDNSDGQLCLTVAHRLKNLQFGFLGPWGIFERCTVDDSWESWHSLGTYNNTVDFTNENVPATYSKDTIYDYQGVGAYHGSRWVYDVNNWTYGTTCQVKYNYSMWDY